MAGVDVPQLITDGGNWNAATNSPGLVDGTGTAGVFYHVTVAGTRDLGSGAITFVVGDSVVYTGAVWERVSGQITTDQSVNYTSLSDFAAKTETDWTDEIYTAEENRWGDAGVLGGLFAGLSQGKPFIAALIEAVVHEVFDDITDFFSDVDDAFGALASNFSGKWRDIINAKDAADYANAQLAVSTRLIKDLFDGAAGGLNAALWVIQYFDQGFAGGTPAQDGRGNCWWDGVGAVTRAALARYIDQTTDTDNQVITIVMPNRVQSPVWAPLINQYTTPESWLRILGRMNTAQTSYMWAQIGHNSVALGCVTNNTETVFSSTGCATQDGDVWDFYIGSEVNDYSLRLRRNGVDVLTYVDDSSPENNTDGSHVSVKGEDYRSVGFFMYAAHRGIFLTQTSPGTIAVFSASDN